MVLKGGLEHLEHLKLFESNDYIHADVLLRHVFVFIHLGDVICKVDALESELYLSFLPFLEAKESNTILGLKTAHNLAVELASTTTSAIIFAATYYKKLVDAVLGKYFYLCSIIKVTTFNDLIFIDLKEQSNGQTSSSGS
jgi:hypothetical protein